MNLSRRRAIDEAVTYDLAGIVDVSCTNERPSGSDINLGIEIYQRTVAVEEGAHGGIAGREGITYYMALAVNAIGRANCST